MVGYDAAADVGDDGRTTRFWLHLLDNLFRRLFLYAIPVILLLVIGVWAAQGTSEVYESEATLDASENPLLGEAALRGELTSSRLTSSEATVAYFEEQMQTDVFATAIAEAAGLGDALEAGLIGTDTIRENISASPNGASIITVSATWADPTTAQLLTQAAIDSYRDYVVATVASDSLAAIDFYTERRQQAEAEVAEAEAELTQYVDGLPVVDPDNRPIEQELTIERLNNNVDRAEASVDAAAAETEIAQLQVAQARSEAGQSVRMIDPPGLPSAPEPRAARMISIVFVFGALGLLISGVALVVTTALDRSVRFVADVTYATDTTNVSTVPRIKALRRRRFRRRKRSARKRAAKAALAEADDVADDADDAAAPADADDVAGSADAGDAKETVAASPAEADDEAGPDQGDEADDAAGPDQGEDADDVDEADEQPAREQVNGAMRRRRTLAAEARRG